MLAKQFIEINLPASKSIVNRLLIIEKLSGKNIVEKKDISCDDAKVLSQALNSKKCRFNVKLSGTAMRFMTAFLAQKKGKWTLTGLKSLQMRPVGELVEFLKMLGAEIYYLKKEGFLPLKIIGKKLCSATLEIENPQSSQTVSALMLIAPMLDNGLTIRLKNISSFPYVLLTKKIMEDCGAKLEFSDNIIKIFPQKFSPEKFPIEADWSAAAFWYAYAAVSDTEPTVLNNLFSNSYQPDSVVKDIFKEFGVISDLNAGKSGFNKIILKKNPRKSALSAASVFKYNFKNNPDLVPALSVTCCANNIKFVFSGVKNLKIKECNRLSALVCELRKCGFNVKNSSDFLFWNGKKCNPQNPVKIETYNDHRIAMAFAILSQKIDLEILNPQVVKKSYYGFWRDLNMKNCLNFRK
ncbi:MAG: 3-phosphoshikimate 1-carboxyvinyltransferase [Prevotellaceae bacterium]|jgi:3-phosphoshikimate 1-carboxyvinyltransferase|nr:3-phosphoshikimate 1-carboxyvinyltransferase [Prevotellaceae bacterium]